MYYLHLTKPTSEHQGPRPRDFDQGPFASAREAQGYVAKLMMWFPEAMRETDYQIVDRQLPAHVGADLTPVDPASFPVSAAIEHTKRGNSHRPGCSADD